ncbi:MAG: VOC family protein [Cyclobacteriaceae bacterium]
MKEGNYQIEGLTIAVTNMDQMLEFYSNVFGVEFTEMKMYGTSLYSTEWSGLKLLFCPAEIAGIDANRNRQQFDIRVNTIEQSIDKSLKHNGKMLGELQITEELKTVAVFDPDGNSIVFKEYLKT